MTLKESLQQRILVLDGAMGTLVGQFGFTTGNTDHLNLTHPDTVVRIHQLYLEAGADIITTNTFSSQVISQADYHLESQAYDMALEGARIARQMADRYSTPERPRFVLGDVGPTNKTASLSPDVDDPAAREVSYDQLFEAYYQQISALVSGGVDAILIETIFDTLNCKAALAAALAATASAPSSSSAIPIMLSLTISDLSGRTLSGQTLEAFLSTISSFPILSVGLNCGFGAQEMLPFLRQLAQRAPYFVSAHPNAGLPDELGRYNQTASSMLPAVQQMLDEGLLNIIGGCCGTDPTFIAAYARIVQGAKPRQPRPRYRRLHLAGLEPLQAVSAQETDFSPAGLSTSFINVGERCNVAGSRKFLRLINEKSYDQALDIARKQVDDGALVLDINMDDGLLDASAEMTHFLRLIASEPAIARVPVMIDSSDWNVIVAALKQIQGKPIVNSISLKEGPEAFVAKARQLRSFGAAVVVMCFDERGQALSYERKIEIAGRAYRLLTEEAGMPADDIIFDPNILAVATGMPEHDAYALDFIRAAEWIRTNCQGAHVSGGVSNLSFSFRGNNYIREAMHAVFLYHAIRHGMDMAIVNPATKVAYHDIPPHELRLIEDVILNRHPAAAEALTVHAQSLLQSADASAAQPSAASASALEPQLPLAERLVSALRRGVATNLAADLEEALTVYPSPVDIIEGPLMDGMNQVGRLFGEGKMFLPQVVKTARTMKLAVEILQPHIQKDSLRGDANRHRPTIVIATVKGDVHDIGKNIVAVVMACNDYRVVDLGVMVPPEKIVDAAIAERADIVCLSGLITPSLTEMTIVAQQMQRAGLRIPLMIGGATTSQMHTALKIATEYDGPVLWMKDAAQNPLAAARILGKEKETYHNELRLLYSRLRDEYARRSEPNMLSIGEAREKRIKLFEK